MKTISDILTDINLFLSDNLNKPHSTDGKENDYSLQKFHDLAKYNTIAMIGNCNFCSIVSDYLAINFPTLKLRLYHLSRNTFRLRFVAPDDLQYYGFPENFTKNSYNIYQYQLTFTVGHKKIRFKNHPYCAIHDFSDILIPISMHSDLDSTELSKTPEQILRDFGFEATNRDKIISDKMKASKQTFKTRLNGHNLTINDFQELVKLYQASL